MVRSPAEALAEIRIATESDRREIARLRHDVYASEIGQHPINDQGELSDPLDHCNVMLVALWKGRIAGFISLTPPNASSFSIDKYFRRSDLPFKFHGRLFEARILTVVRSFRGTEIASLLLYAALRWVEAHQGTHIVAIGRREVLKTYLQIGMRRQNHTVKSGAVTYELLLGEVSELRANLARFSRLIDRFKRRIFWNLPFPFQIPGTCFHGGAFFSAIGERFDSLWKADSVINADVLDAWYPPAPSVIQVIQDYLPWLMRTSPPVHCEGLVEMIAQTRGVNPENILPGAGSSDLIFRVLRQWLSPTSRVLILDPMYGEYAHVLESVIGCRVERMVLQPENSFCVSAEEFFRAASDFDLIILVNPNSPTGQHIDRSQLKAALRCVPVTTRVWVDETYVDYAGNNQSLERIAADSKNIIVCKSMSKIYALSGLRVAYLCGGAHLLESLRPLTPPWVVGLLAQVAAVEALQNPDYYQARLLETHQLREQLAVDLRKAGWQPVSGVANFLLCRLPDSGPDAEWLISRCKSHELYLRNPESGSSESGGRWVRIAVKDQGTNVRMLKIICSVMDEFAHANAGCSRG